MIKSRSGRIYYALQVASGPPTFVLFVNDPSLFTDTYKRYLEKKIRESLKFQGTPIRMIFRGKALRKIAYDTKKGEISKTVKEVMKSR